MNCPNCNNPIPDETIIKEANSINGKKSKKGKRSDLKKGGSTYNKIHGEKGGKK
jgi:hypothetical protein